MTRAAYVGVENFARNVKSIYVGVDDTARSVTKGYVGDENGIARQFWPPKKSGGGSFDPPLPPYEPPVYPPIVPEDNTTCEHCDESCHGWLDARDWRDYLYFWSGSSAYPGAVGDPPYYYSRHYHLKFCLRTKRILGYIEYGNVTYPGGELPDSYWQTEYQGMQDCNDTQHRLPYIPGVWWFKWRRGNDGYWYVDLPNSPPTSNNTSAMYDPDNFTEENEAVVLQNAQLNNPIEDVDLEPI
ncbi:MAG: hypothetical protein LBP87_13445 [Planctomycetaceae bacterium]|jgi:hypothetical protein|nr:hypothetical protein [Planctomycetaceae bacterium]